MTPDVNVLVAAALPDHAQHAVARGWMEEDAWISASVLHHHEHLVTFDRGFRRLLPARHVTVLRR